MFRVMQAHLSDLTMSPLRFARGQALSTVKGLARWAARSFPFVPQGFGSRAQDDKTPRCHPERSEGSLLDLSVITSKYSLTPIPRNVRICTYKLFLKG